MLEILVSDNLIEQTHRIYSGFMDFEGLQMADSSLQGFCEGMDTLLARAWSHVVALFGRVRACLDSFTWLVLFKALKFLAPIPALVLLYWYNQRKSRDNVQARQALKSPDEQTPEAHHMRDLDQS